MYPILLTISDEKPPRPESIRSGRVFMPFFRFRFLLVLLAGAFFVHPAASDTAAIIPIHLLIVFHTSLVLPEIVKNRRPVSCCISCCIFLKKGFFCEIFSRRKKENFPKTEKKNRINTEFFSIHAVLTFGPPGGIRTPGLQNRNLLRYPASPRADVLLNWKTASLSDAKLIISYLFPNSNCFFKKE